MIRHQATASDVPPKRGKEDPLDSLGGTDPWHDPAVSTLVACIYHKTGSIAGQTHPREGSKSVGQSHGLMAAHQPAREHAACIRYVSEATRLADHRQVGSVVRVL